MQLQNDPWRAMKAMRDLLNDPDDLPKVFTVIESLPGQGPAGLREKMLADPEGKRLLDERPSIVPLLSDRARLEAMPPGSLAHAYLAFLDREHISAQGLLDAAAAGESGAANDFGWQHERLRDTHDLWHAVTGYHGDVLGELALLAFNLGQFWHPGIALMVSAGLSKLTQPEGRWLVLEGFVRGRRAALLPAVRWEEWLALPLEEVRTRLRLSAPPVYAPVRSSELRASGRVPMKQ